MTQYDEQSNRVDVLSCMNSLFALGDTECAIEINTARARWCSVGSMELLASSPESVVGVRASRNNQQTAIGPTRCKASLFNGRCRQLEQAWVYIVGTPSQLCAFTGKIRSDIVAIDGPIPSEDGDIVLGYALLKQELHPCHIVREVGCVLPGWLYWSPRLRISSVAFYRRKGRIARPYGSRGIEIGESMKHILIDSSSKLRVECGKHFGP